jgi:hypothetical protein
MFRSYGTLFLIISHHQRIKIRCYNIYRSYANELKSVATILLVPTELLCTSKSHRLDTYCRAGL